MIAREGVLREHSSLLLFIMRSLDLIAVGVAGWVSYWWTSGNWTLSYSYKLQIALGLVCTIVFFNHFLLYRAWRGTSTAMELRVVSGAWLAVFATLGSVYAISGAGLPLFPQWLVSWFIAGWVLLTGFRALLRVVLRVLRSRGYNQRSVIIVGLSERGVQIADQISKANWTGLRVLGYFDDRSPARREVSDPKLPYLGAIADVSRYIDGHEVDQVWVVYPLKAEDKVKAVLHALRHHTVEIRYVLDIFAFNLVNHSIGEVAGVPILNLSASPLQGVNGFIKDLGDRFLALLILAAISPLMLAIAIGVKLSSPGPVFYRQERVSWNNKRFMMLKFRSMPVTVEAETGPVWARKGEVRATRFGAFLRRTSLDELPQFLNVLKGDMSIVGPRPERPIFVDQFKDEIPLYMKKHMVKAGITGWAQVNGWRGDTDLGKRVEHDIYYIEHWSFWLDMKIIFMTLFKGFIHRNAY